MATLGILFGTLFLILLLAVVVVKIANRFTRKMGIKRKRWWLFSHIASAIVYFTGVLGALMLTLFANFMSSQVCNENKVI